MTTELRTPTEIKFGARVTDIGDIAIERWKEREAEMNKNVQKGSQVPQLTDSQKLDKILAFIEIYTKAHCTCEYHKNNPISSDDIPNVDERIINSFHVICPIHGMTEFKCKQI